MDQKKSELAGIAGIDNVSDDKETIESYASDQSFVPPRRPRLVVKPGNTHEVQEIVRWANKTNTPIVPVSSGPPHSRGDTVPGCGGSVIIDLHRMNKVLKIDSKNRIAVVEPGVTHAQLQPQLAKEGLRLPMQLLPRYNKSVLGSVLEREPTLIPKYNWQLTEPLRTIHVVWGNGDTLKSGALSVLGPDLADGAPIYPLGPFQVDYFRIIQAAQGSMGIVTEASVGCEILPRNQKLLFITSQRLDDLIDLAYRLLKFRYADEFLLLNSTSLSYMLGENKEQIKTLRDELPSWIIVLCVAGYEYLPEERVVAQEQDIRDIATQCNHLVSSTISGVSNDNVLTAISNSSSEPYWKLRYKGGYQEIFFLTTLNRTTEFVQTIYSVSEALEYSTTDIGIYIQPLHQGVCCHCEFILPFDPENSGEVAKIKELFSKGSHALFDQRAFFSRPYGLWADLVYSHDTWSTIMLRNIKGIFDPHNVMNPGKLCF